MATDFGLTSRHFSPQ